VRRARREPAFVGRAEELGALESIFAQTRAGRLHCVLLAGEPGTGKTRLAAELLKRHRRSAICLKASGYPFGGTTSFGLWMEALNSFVDRLVAREVMAPPQVTPHQRLTLAITQVMSDLAAESPVVVLLDDIHQADTSSWQALGYLARNLLARRIMIIACTRPAELDRLPTARQILLRLEQDGVLTRVSVTPLGLEETQKLAEAMLDHRAPVALVDWLFDQSQGNPLFGIGLIRTLLDEGANLATPTLRRVPTDMSDQVMTRVASLSRPIRSTLEVLAVIGRSSQFEELAAVIKRPASHLATDLDQLIRAHLLTETADSNEPAYDIIHPLIRETIYQEIPAQRRRIVHRDLARQFAERGRLAEAASHYARCASVGDDEAIDVLIAALDEAEHIESPYEAMSVLEGLLALVPSGDRRWLRVLDAMAWDAEWVLDYNAFVSADTGLRAMREIERSLQTSPDRLREAVVQKRLAGFSVWDLTQAEFGLRTGRRAQEVFDSLGQHRLAMMAEHLISWILGVTDDLRGMEMAARRVINWTEIENDLPLMMHALGALGWSLLRQGQFSEAEQSLERANQIATELGQQVRLGWGLSTLAYALALEGRLPEARESLAKTENVTSGQADARLSASISLLEGNAAAAFATLRHEIRRLERRLNAQHAWALIFAAVAAARLGWIEDAEALVNSMSVYVGRIGLGWDWYRLWALGSLQREQGDTGEALSTLRRAAQGLRSRQSIAMAAMILADAADVACDRNDIAALVEIVGELEAIAMRVDRDLYRSVALLAAAQLQLARVEIQAATTALQAAETLGRLGYRALEARALQVRGRALVDADRREASEALRRVVEITSEGGATRARVSALQLLDQLGRPGRRAARSMPERRRLTTRERQVVRYAAEGLTARKIAQRLRISERTVETHIENAYAKIGVRSRLELVRRASELNL
jgi:DNA-binding CsgD family transcriptional regulator/tetratricopeptide (TPR) repeat protein